MKIVKLNEDTDANFINVEDITLESILLTVEKGYVFVVNMKGICQDIHPNKTDESLKRVNEFMEREINKGRTMYQFDTIEDCHTWANENNYVLYACNITSKQHKG